MIMIIARTFLLASLAAIAVVPSASAKNPHASAAVGELLFAPVLPIGALTPPPKEWAMFDDPPAPPVQPPQPGQPTPPVAQSPKTGNQAPGTSVTAPVTANGGVISKSAVPIAPKRELPVGWLALTAFLCFGVFFACGSLILRKESSVREDVPVVTDDQEIGA